MKEIISVVLLILGSLIMGCSPKVSVTSDNIPPDSLKVTIQCFNLSENLSRNDEVLIIAYLYNDSAALTTPLFHKKLRIDLSNTSKEFQWKLNEDIATKDIILFLIEDDAEVPVEQIDAALRIHHTALRKEFSNRNYKGIEKYLGDDDVLGITIISTMDYAKTYTFSFTGIYKLDKYDYLIKIERNQSSSKSKE